ncbi:MAG: hypothetical protein V4654_15090 [Bdellovibrionota bacterium]
MKYDATGIWFEAFKALGEPSEILFDFKVKDQNHSEKLLYSHSQGDATAAIYEISSKYDFILSKVVEKTSPPPVKFLTYLKQILIFNYHARPRFKKLWPFAITACTTTETLYAHFVIDKHAVIELKSKLQHQKISLNTHLLHTLNLATRSYLKPVRKDLVWIVPVNFRRELGLKTDAPGNQAANFTCVIEDETALQLQQNISGLLKSKRHWGTWFWQNASIWMPFSLVKFFTKARLHPNYCAGVFTNLGDWQSPTEFSHFTFFANPILSHPIVASSLEMNGALTLGIRLYPSFPLTSQQLQGYLQTWKNNILR